MRVWVLNYIMSYFLATSFLIISVIVIFPQGAIAFDERLLDSVVSVIPGHYSKKHTEQRINQKRQAPEGTGVALFPGGFIVTNSHVLGKAESVDIRLRDGRLIKVKIVGRDIFTDIALLKAPVDFPVLLPAFSAKLASPVCAIGNQFGLGLSITCGVVSAMHRTGLKFNPIEDFIQTDAVINPGGSGGALVNELGQMIGLVSAIFTKESDSNIGVNFATSINMVLRVAKDLKNFGQVKRGKSGLRVESLDRKQRRTQYGAAITHIKHDAAAFNAGLKRGHIITKIGLRSINKASDVSSAFHKFRPGDEIQIEFFEKDNKKITTIILGE